MGVLLLATAATATAATAPSCLGAKATIVGTDRGDVITGTAGDDVIAGLGGNDVVSGLGGRDRICGGDGNDSIDGGDDADSIDGGVGRNVIGGGDGDDVLTGGADSDAISGGLGADRIVGGAANDSIDGDDGGDLILGGSGNDLLHGESGNDVIRGESGDDSLYGDDGNDLIDGSEGRDGLSGLAGNDRMIGGSGNDSIVGGDGSDTLRGGAGNDAMRGDAGRDSLDGEAGDDSVDGGDGDDFTAGGPGKDALVAGAGDDIVDGGPEADAMDGGAGTDVCRQETADNSILGCERLNESARYETTNGVRQWVTAATGGTVTWSRYSLTIPAGAMASDCWAAISLLPDPVSGPAGEQIAGLVDMDIDCDWTGAVEVGVPTESASATDGGTALAHYDDLRDSWSLVAAERTVDGVAYAHVDHLSAFSSFLLNAREIAYCTRPLTFNASRCVSAQAAAQIARLARTALFSDDVDSDKGNAFKHCTWSLLMTRSIGADAARDITTNHENVGSEGDWDDSTEVGRQRHMDLLNNAAGRRIASRGGDYVTVCLNALYAGELFYIVQGHVVATNFRLEAPITPPALRYYDKLPYIDAGGGSDRVSLSKGGSAQGRPGCSAAACAYMTVHGQGFAANRTVTVECGSNSEGVFYTYYARTGGDGTLSSSACYFGFAGQVAWARVDGIASGGVTW